MNDPSDGSLDSAEIPAERPEKITRSYVATLLRRECLFEFAPQGSDVALIELLVAVRFLIEERHHLYVASDPTLLLKYPNDAGREFHRAVAEYAVGDGSKFRIMNFIRSVPKSFYYDAIPSTIYKLPAELKELRNRLIWESKDYISMYRELSEELGTRIYKLLLEMYETQTRLVTESFATHVAITDVIFTMLPGANSTSRGIALSDLKYDDPKLIGKAIFKLGRAWARSPGLRTLRTHSVPTPNDMMKLAQEALWTAIESQDEAHTIEFVRRAFSQAASYTGLNSPDADSMLALQFVLYFRDLKKNHNGWEWNAEPRIIERLLPLPYDRSSAHISHVDDAIEYQWIANREIVEIRFLGERSQFKQSRGLQLICQLLRHRGEAISTMDLESAIDGEPRFPNSEQDALDTEARKHIQAELDDLREQIQVATDKGDADTVLRLERDLHSVLSHARQSIGLRGKSRRLPSESGQSRSRVGNSIRAALNRIRQTMPKLAAHLDQHLKSPTGLSPRYEPDPPVTWVLREQ